MHLAEDKLGVDVLEIYDGRTAWVQEKGSSREDPGRAKYLSQIVKRTLYILLRYTDPAVRLQYLGQETASEKTVHRVNLAELDTSTRLSFDAHTGLLTGMSFHHTAPGEAETTEIRWSFSDFQPVGRVQMPHHVVEYWDGKELGDVRFSSISNSENLPDSLFERPQ